MYQNGFRQTKTPFDRAFFARMIDKTEELCYYFFVKSCDEDTR